ncbi:MAG: peptidoglycan-associated lipoprotein Pal [Hyphomonadaceae bacterium]|nr:peptidoglycan-associated lipoprotein Pal [Hyphomonadaceae bacterium]
MRHVAPLIALSLAVGLGACASKKVEQTPPQVAVPAPAPAPLPPASPQGPTPGSLEDFRVSVGERVFFGYDQYDLSAEARQTLEKQAAWLRQYGSVRVLVAGNADERGTREYNLALGARRAAATKDYLVSLGVPSARIDTVSYGKERPLNPGTSEDAHRVNRNAHTQLVSGTIS